MAGYLDPQQSWDSMLTKTTGTNPPTDVTGPVSRMGTQGSVPTSGLYDLASNSEAGFVQTAPKGYIDPNAPINAPAGAGKGWVEGYLARQELNRQNATLGMLQEEQGWKRTDREKKRMIDDGMAEAAQNGGYNGVIDYLQTADPDRAMEFQSKKLDLDAKIMKNGVMQALLPTEKAKAMAEGYGVLGKMGFALLKAPAEERANMYQTMLPIIKQVNPDAPSSLNQSAVDMFALGIAQSSDENQLYGYSKQQTQMQGDLGKAIEDAHKISLKYGSDSKEAQLAAQNVNLIMEQKQSDIASTASNLLNKANKNNMSQESVLRKEVQSLNKNYMTVQDNFNKIQTIAQNYNSTGPNAAQNFGPSDTALIFNFMKILDPTSVVRESEFATAANSGGVPQAIQAEYNRVLKGGVLSPTMRNEFIRTSKQLYEASKKSYDQNNQTYRNLATSLGVDPNNVVLNVNSTIQSGTQIINSKADALLQKYQGNPEAIKKVEALRQQQLQALQQKGQEDDHQADQLRQQYNRQ
jgi:hypothetical protein